MLVLCLLFCLASSVNISIAVPVSKFAKHQIEEDSIACPCSDPSLCNPVSGPPLREKEIFGFGQPNTKFDFWKNYTTTIAWADNVTFVCEAHAYGIRVVMGAPEVVLSPNQTERSQWIVNAISLMQSKFMDGIVFDYEDPLAITDPRNMWYVALVNETRIALHNINPSYQTSTCVAWSPDDIDGRGYDVVGLASASDVLYVMDYDTRSQVLDVCIASANSPFAGTIRGIQRYFDIGISGDKLVLGVAWYGYKYTCLPPTKPTDKFCSIAFVPFRGVNCSDAAGSEIPYVDLLSMVHSQLSPTGVVFDESTQTPYFNMVDDSNNCNNSNCNNTNDSNINNNSNKNFNSNKALVVNQYWFDNPQSLMIKYQFARQKGLRGVGPFMFGYLDDSDEDGSAEMWNAFDAFLG